MVYGLKIKIKPETLVPVNPPSPPADYFFLSSIS